MFEDKIRKLMAAPSFPIAVSGLEAIDPWFKETSKNQEIFAALLSAKFGNEFFILRIEDLKYVARISQEPWAASLQSARGLLNGPTLIGQQEDYVKSLILDELPSEASEFSKLFWDSFSSLLHFAVDDKGQSVFVGAGRGAENHVRGILESSDKPLHFTDIFKRLQEVDGVELEVRRVHNAAASVGYLLGRGTYGLDKHIQVSNDFLMEIANQIDSFVTQSVEIRQWKTEELIEFLDFEYDLLNGIVDHFIVDIALKKYSTLESLGRMVWQKRGAAEAPSERLDIANTVFEILERAGKPLKASQIETELKRLRGVSGVLQVHNNDRIIRIAPGVWGLNDRDVSIKRHSQPTFLDDVYRFLIDFGKGIHMWETDKIIDPETLSPSALFSICKRDDRFSTDINQFLFLKEWGEPRRLPFSRVVQNVVRNSLSGLTLRDVHSQVEEDLGFSIESRRVSAVLARSDFVFIEESQKWFYSEHEADEDADDF